jgi:arylsulfatase A-like enzyme
MSAWDWSRRGLGLALGVLGVVAIARVRAAAPGGPLPVAPHASSKRQASPAPSTRDPKTLGVVVRLVDRLGSASYYAPELRRAERLLTGYWRRMRSPYVGPGGNLGRAVHEVALVRSQGEGKAVGTGKGWNPNPRIWNMAEGSFDQREAILAPPPCTIRYQVQIPAHAWFETAPAVLATGGGPVVFELAVRRAQAERRVLLSTVVKPGGGTDPKAPRSWSDIRVDLGEFSGEKVELELATSLAEPGTTAAAFWGTPVVLAPGASSLPFNVLFVVIDALRGDAVAATHDPALDDRMARAPVPPLDAWLPRMPEVAPNLDALAARGVVLQNAWSAGNWSRPGTIAMLAGARSGTLGLNCLDLVPPQSEVRTFYAAKPAFLPLALRPEGVVTRAFVNNFYMVGYAGTGVDMGFEGVVDHRYDTLDTEKITRDTLAWLRENHDRRFALFVNYNSPHGPYAPPRAAVEAIPPPPRGPRDQTIRMYLAEIHKDDAALGQLLGALDELGLRDDTLVVVTADHGETLSQAHDGVAMHVDRNPPPGRFQHLRTIWDETVRVPIILSWPKGLPANSRVTQPVDTTVILPTILELAGIPVPPVVSGDSVVGLIRGKSAPERPVVTEGRGARAIRLGEWRLVVRDPIAQLVRTRKGVVTLDTELYQVDRDPGEREEVSARHPDVVARLRRLLDETTGRIKTASTPAATGGTPATVRLRFVGAGGAHRVTGLLTTSGSLTVEPVGLRPNAVRRVGEEYRIDLLTRPREAVGMDLRVDPPVADLRWQLELDGKAWPAEAVFAGSFGTVAPELVQGLVGEANRAQAAAEVEPILAPHFELGLFVTRTAAAREIELGVSTAANQEAMRLMQAWGYARADDKQP